MLACSEEMKLTSASALFMILLWMPFFLWLCLVIVQKNGGVGNVVSEFPTLLTVMIFSLGCFKLSTVVCKKSQIKYVFLPHGWLLFFTLLFRIFMPYI
jgi:hypothetical protein